VDGASRSRGSLIAILEQLVPREGDGGPWGAAS
jgi:hypothetical protein